MTRRLKTRTLNQTIDPRVLFPWLDVVRHRRPNMRRLQRRLQHRGTKVPVWAAPPRVPP